MTAIARCHIPVETLRFLLNNSSMIGETMQLRIEVSTAGLTELTGIDERTLRLMRKAGLFGDHVRRVAPKEFAFTLGPAYKAAMEAKNRMNDE